MQAGAGTIRLKAAMKCLSKVPVMTQINKTTFVQWKTEVSGLT